MMDKIWIGSPGDIKIDEKAEKVLTEINDSKFWTDKFGIISVNSDRWKEAQNFESTGWFEYWSHANSDRNLDHLHHFGNYDNVPKDLGDVIEIGCGPFTQLQTIQQNRTIKSVTLLDPLIKEYPRLPNCIYKDGRFMGHDTTFISDQAEKLTQFEKFDTAICINVLEHVQDVFAILEALYFCVKPNGVLIFGERTYDNLDINAVYDVGHPIRIKQLVVDNFLKHFTEKYLKELPDHDWGSTTYFIGRKNAYTCDI